jgi:hypothetical protein
MRVADTFGERVTDRDVPAEYGHGTNVADVVAIRTPQRGW